MEQTTEATEGKVSGAGANKWRYMPEVGQRVHMKGYASNALNNHVLTVQEVGSEHAMLSIKNWTEEPEATVLVSLEEIEAPIGWHERYTITVAPEQVEQVLGWLSRGIAVRQSHYMPTCPTAFQPLDNCDVPGWKFAGNTLVDKIGPEDVKERIKIVKLDRVWDAFVMGECKYCGGTGARVAQSCHVHNPNVVDCQCGHEYQSHEEDRKYDPASVHSGKCWKRGCECEAYKASRKPVELGEKFRCFTCRNGQDAIYLNGMDKKTRAETIKGLEKEGWTVGYRKGNAETRGWWMERETVVKEWGEDPKP